MKTKLFLLLGTLVMLWSCDEDLLSYDFDTTFNETIVINIEDNNLKTNAFPFESTDTINIEDNEDLEEYLDLLSDITMNEINYKLNGIPEGQEITELNIVIEQTELNVQLNKLTKNNISEVLETNIQALNSVANQLLSSKILIIKTSGISSYAPMHLSVDLEFESTITTSI